MPVQAMGVIDASFETTVPSGSRVHRGAVVPCSVLVIERCSRFLERGFLKRFSGFGRFIVCRTNRDV